MSTNATRGTAPTTTLTRHPAWCTFSDSSSFEGIDTTCDGDHMSAPVNVAATAGSFEVRDAGAMFPRVETYAITPDRTPAVALSLFVGRRDEWIDVRLTPANAKALADDLLALTECGVTRMPAADRCEVWAARADGSTGVLLMDLTKRGNARTVAAQLRPEEVSQLAANLTRAAGLFGDSDQT